MAAHSNPSSSSSENLKIIVEKNPSKSRLSELNIKCWPKWACPPGKYKLKYEAEETCYMVRGKVKAYYNSNSNSNNAKDESSRCNWDFVEFGAGDLVTFPKGVRCTWLVSAPVDKYYMFQPPSPSSS